MKLHETKEKANYYLELADHMTKITYNVVKNPKLMLTMIENLFLSMTNTMTSILIYEKTNNRSISFKDNFASKLIVFMEKCVPKYNIRKEHTKLMEELKGIIISRRKSPVEFQRGTSLVICSENYSMKIITIDKIKKYVEKARDFKKHMETIVKNERILV